MKNGKYNLSLKPPSKSPGRKIQVIKTNPNVRHSYFSVLRNLTKEKSSLIMPAVEKRQRKYLEDLYTKYSANLEVYLINNKRDIKLYGSRRYENESFDSILNDIKSNKGKVIEKLRNKPLPCSITEYDDDKIILTPLPNKSRQTLESSKDKEEFFNAERQAVVMRTVEYTHAVRNKQNSEETIKAIREFEQHSNDKTNRLLMLKLFKKPVNVIEAWWFSLKKRRNKGGDDSNYQVKRHRTAHQEDNTLNYIDNFNNDSTDDYGFDHLTSGTQRYNNNANEQNKSNTTTSETNKRQLAARVIFNRLQSKEREYFCHMIQLLDSYRYYSESVYNNSNERDRDKELMAKAKLLASRFIFNKLRDEGKCIFNKFINNLRAKDAATTNYSGKSKAQISIATNESSFKIKGAKKEFSIDDLEEEREYYFELITDKNDTVGYEKHKVGNDNSDGSDNNEYKENRFGLMEIEYEISFQINNEEITAFASKCIKCNNSNTNLSDYKSNAFDINSIVIDYLESILISPEDIDTNKGLYCGGGDDDDNNNTGFLNIRCKTSLNEWALVTKETYINIESNTECIKLLQSYFRSTSQDENKGKAYLNDAEEDELNYSDEELENKHNQIHSIRNNVKRIKSETIIGNAIIHRVLTDTKSTLITKERKRIMTPNQQPKSRNQNSLQAFQPTKSEDIQIHPNKIQIEGTVNNQNNLNKSYDEDLENSLRGKLLKQIITNQNKKINKEMKQLEESYHNSFSCKKSLLQFAKKKLLQISSMHFYRHFHDYFSEVITYEKPPSPLVLALNIYHRYILYPRLMKWHQNSRKTIYLKKRISEVSIVIHLQITKRKMIKLFSVIGRPAKQSFFYRMILIYMFSNDIKVNYNPMIAFLNQGFANQYLFSLANALSLGLTKPVARYERHSFIPYVRQLVNLDISLNYNSRPSGELNKTTDEVVQKDHLSWMKESKEGNNAKRDHSVDDLCIRDFGPEERNTITVKTISLKKK